MISYFPVSCQEVVPLTFSLSLSLSLHRPPSFHWECPNPVRKRPRGGPSGRAVAPQAAAHHHHRLQEAQLAAAELPREESLPQGRAAGNAGSWGGGLPSASASSQSLPRPPETPRGSPGRGRSAYSCLRLASTSFCPQGWDLWRLHNTQQEVVVHALSHAFLKLNIWLLLYLGHRRSGQGVSFPSGRGPCRGERRRRRGGDLVQPHPRGRRRGLVQPPPRAAAGAPPGGARAEAQQGRGRESGRQRRARGALRRRRWRLGRWESGECGTFHRGTTSAQTDARVQTSGGGGAFQQQSHRWSKKKKATHTFSHSYFPSPFTLSLACFRQLLENQLPLLVLLPRLRLWAEFCGGAHRNHSWCWNVSN